MASSSDTSTHSTFSFPLIAHEYISAAARLENGEPMHEVFSNLVYFANLPQYVKEPYKRFLENKMREKWNLTGTPINIYIRQK